jgi:hypothetical protein
MIARNLRFAATTLALALMLLACGTSNETQVQMTKKDINAVKDAHTAHLMSIPGVVGVAVGELADHTPCILVLVVEDTDQVRGAVPDSLEGHPVSIFESGEIKPLDGN